MKLRLSFRCLCIALLAAATSLTTHAGRIVPTAMRLLADDMSGQYSHVLDKQGRECALVKVKLPYEGAEFGGVIKTEARPGFYNVWIEDGLKMMEVYFPNCEPVRVHFGDFMKPAGVVAPRTYELTFDIDALEFMASRNKDLGSEYAIFSLSPVPDGAALLRSNGMSESFDAEGKAMMLLPYGTHEFTILADGFADYSGNVTVTKGESATVDVKLRSTKSLLTIECATPGATISVQGDKKSTTGRWSGELPAGSYKVEVSKQGYESITRLATLTAGAPLTLNLPELQAITGSLRVEVKPIGCTVKVDGKEAGTTPMVLRDLLIGPHKIEVTKQGYDPYTTTLTITEGLDNPALTATLTATLTETPTDYLNLSLTDLRRRAEAGDPDAQFQLGSKYYNGDSVTRDYTEAIRWYRKAAEQGDAGAQNSLGVAYDFGEGVTKDCTEAVKWFRKAAEQGAADAQYNLGSAYEYGRGVTKDYTEAVKWYRKAAEQGGIVAQASLGDMYENGRGVAKDINEAVKWYRKAAAQGDVWSQSRLRVLGY